MSKHEIHGVLTRPDLGKCPSCNTVMALAAMTELDKLYTCPTCHAYSYAYKWLADGGKSAKQKVSRLFQ